MPTKLMEVSIPCRRYAHTRYFYTVVLGLPVGKEGKHHCFLDTGGSWRLALVDALQLAAHTQPSGHGAYFNLSTDNLTHLRRRLQENSVRIEAETADEYGRNLTVHDPEGNVVNIFLEGTY